MSLELLPSSRSPFGDRPKNESGFPGERMGVIKKTLYAKKSLLKQRHRSLFLDMEENIHIHYRDLRIELSRLEFEEFVKVFSEQSAELSKIIRENNYQDGVLTNSNQEEFRVVTHCKLENEVKYHPQRLAIEECTDGYHLHYRNYKILIDPQELKTISEIFKSTELNGSYASSYQEILKLFEENDLDFTISSENIPGKVLSLCFAKYHYGKARSILKAIGIESSTQKTTFTAETSEVKIIASLENKLKPIDYKKIRSARKVQPLFSYLESQAASIDPNELNLIKLQALELFSAVRDGVKKDIDLDPTSWLYSPDTNKIIYPYSAVPASGKAAADKLYRSWANILSNLGLGFIKPQKRILPKKEQEALQSQVYETIARELKSVLAVDKIYLNGSALRADMGIYQTPFIHGQMAKIGSDIDLLIEINPERENDLPPTWKLHALEAGNKCSIYHIDQIPLGIAPVELKKSYPHVKFNEHLIDAYVYFPSRAYAAEKEAFLKKHTSKVIFDRSQDPHIMKNQTAVQIAENIRELYNFKEVFAEKIELKNENVFFRILADTKMYFLKIFHVCGNFSSSRLPEHTAYEAQLLIEINERGTYTPKPISGKSGPVQMINGAPAILFEYLPGRNFTRPEYPTEQCAETLAKFHLTQRNKPIQLAKSFTCDDLFGMWTCALSDFSKIDFSEPGLSDKVRSAHQVLENRFPPSVRSSLIQRAENLHLHGDPKPMNMMRVKSGEIFLIDFNNCFWGPKFIDIIFAAYDFALGEGFVHLFDVARFDKFLQSYFSHCPMTAQEKYDLEDWICLLGIIKFTAEVKMYLDKTTRAYRLKRADIILDIITQHPKPGAVAA